MRTYPYPVSEALLLLPLPDAIENVNLLCEARLKAFLRDRALIAQFRALPPRAVCRTCGGVGERVSLSRCSPTPCPVCRSAAFAEFLAAEAYGREALAPFLVAEGYGPELEKKPEVKTWVATDLTLRCCACGSNVDKRDGVVHCFTCERGKKP